MPDMTVEVQGTRLLAERACRTVFGEDTNTGPAIQYPPPALLKLLDDWPKGRTGDVLTVALEMPVRFDISKPMNPAETKSVALRVCRVTVLYLGSAMGYALRTNRLGLDAIRLWRSTHEARQRQIRQAH